MEETEVIIEKRSCREWGPFVVRGIIALIVGIAVLLWTGITLEILTYLFGVMALVYGVTVFAFGSTHPVGETRTTLTMLLGILSIVLGIIAFIWPWLMAAALVTLLAILAIFIGFSDIALAIFVIEGTGNRLLLGISGALSVIVGGIFIAFPILGGLVVVALYLGVFAIAYGIISIFTGISLRGQKAGA
ncbi:MAG: hypothetical protein PWP08_213 [Methanofollis sp.]|nr:hypothetical protein [Methanofollis sp.]